jgi:hypothetical protein
MIFGKTKAKFFRRRPRVPLHIEITAETIFLARAISAADKSPSAVRPRKDRQLICPTVQVPMRRRRVGKDASAVPTILDFLKRVGTLPPSP